ncbi:MAG: DciA family protein [Blastocatellia bacterium]
MNSMLKMLPEMIRQAGENEDVREQAAFAAWRVATGGRLDVACVPFGLHQRTLIIAVRDPMWKLQMEQEARGFVFKLNSLLGAPLVTYIEFRVDPASVARAQKQQPPGEEYEFRHTERLMRELEPLAEGIQNDELRATFLRAAAKCVERIYASRL